MNALRRHRHFVALACVALITPACATIGRPATASPSLQENVAGFEQMPDSTATRLGLAVPASAPCHRGHGSSADIVCPLVALDATYYANINAVADSPDAVGSGEQNNHAQVAEDE
jgi:hypothetical protein